MRITFHGAAETVTGSRHLIETDEATVLVDCGLFQGIKRLRVQNREPFPVEPSAIDAVVLTHAHIDHSGYLPALVRDGFNGPIWCSEGTADLVELLLLDSAHLQEEEARYANRHHTSRHSPALPLYTTRDAERALELIETMPFGEEVTIAPGIGAHLRRAGHILGSATVRLQADGTSVLFSGDLGRAADRVMRPPEPPLTADYLVTESTYGNRLHDGGTAEALQALAEVINRTTSRGGTVLIPSFAVGRAQSVLALISDLMESGRVARVPVYLNSPMAIDATELLLGYPEEHQLTEAECRRLEAMIRLVHTAEESKQLNRRHGPMIVVSASGMATGGRVLHHLIEWAPSHRNAIVFAGFQASGTRGASIVAGEREIKIFGRYVPVRADVVQLDGLSAHADQDELIGWLSSGQLAPEKTFVVHGEPAAADSFRRCLSDRLGWEAVVPTQGQAFELAARS